MRALSRLWLHVISGGRFGALGLVVGSVLIILMSVLFWRLGSDISLYRAEIDGARQIQSAYAALNAVQRHRDLSVAVLIGDAAQEQARAEAATQASVALGELGALLPDSLRQGQRWHEAQGDWRDIQSDGLDWTVIESYRRHSAMIERLIVLLVDIADDSELTLAAHLDTYYLQNMLAIRLPRVQEYLSQLRAIGTYALTRRNMGDEVKQLARDTMAELDARMKLQQIDVDRLTKAVPERAAAINDGQEKLRRGVRALMDTLHKDVLGDQFKTVPTEYFSTVSAHIDIGHQVAAQVYQPELAERLGGYIYSARILAVLVTLGVVIAVLSLSRLVNTVVDHAAALEQANQDLAAENERRRQTEEELRVAMARALGANRAKSEFLANLSHEVRTPLNGILGMADLLDMSELNDEQAPLLDEMTRSGKALKAMLDRIIDFTHIEGGAITLARSPFSLREMIQSCLRRHEKEAVAKGLVINMGVDEGVPEILVGDGRRLQQALDCLVDNAVKFTGAGHIDVAVREQTQGSSDESFALHLSVSDTGIGVAADKREFIFESFSQADGSITRRVGGNGLGLAIARRLIELMGGSVSVDDRPGGGSVFAMDLGLGRFNETWTPAG